jgi:hypothetical protein
MSNEGPRYEHSAAAAQDIINLYINRGDPPAILYSKILYRILEAQYAAALELAELRAIISNN